MAVDGTLITSPHRTQTFAALQATQEGMAEYNLVYTPRQVSPPQTLGSLQCLLEEEQCDCQHVSSQGAAHPHQEVCQESVASLLPSRRSDDRALGSSAVLSWLF